MNKGGDKPHKQEGQTINQGGDETDEREGKGVLFDRSDNCLGCEG